MIAFIVNIFEKEKPKKVYLCYNKNCIVGTFNCRFKIVIYIESREFSESDSLRCLNLKEKVYIYI